ncbi:MAG: protein tyrosine phosphatase [Bacteroidetes bacterium]|nr:protein tyrosine phosphatase [Bacteroidota bacterium]MBI3481439.1 protein tyrosine phosphatase [Bacteroidota bacterium]
MNLLFICSRNQWRSPTAEAIFKSMSGIQVRSGGTENSARIRVSEKMVLWADLVFVMEKKHKTRLVEKFSSTATAQVRVTANFRNK